MFGSVHLEGDVFLYVILLLFFHFILLLFTAMAVCNRLAVVFYIYVGYRCLVFILTALMLISLNEAVTTREARIADFQETNDCNR